MRRSSFLISLVAASLSAAGLAGGCGSDEASNKPSVLEDGGGGTGGSRFDGGSQTQSLFGGPCLEDADCPGEGLVCLTQTGTSLFGGGPSDGMCSAPCTSPDDCSAIDPNAYCILTNDNGTARDFSDDSGYCFESCQFGPPAAGEVKCHDRTDFSCNPDSQGLGAYCWPTCAGDAQCGAPDRICDLNWGVCRDPADRTGTLAIGAECDPNATENECALGFCFPMTDTYAFCSGMCSFGSIGCGADLSSADPLDAYCALSALDADYGDVAFCSQLCDCNDDCLHPDSVCLEVGSDFAQLTGHPGFCYPRELSDLPDGGFDPGIECETPPDAGTPDSGTTTPDSGTTTPDSGTSTPTDAGTGG